MAAEVIEQIVQVLALELSDANGGRAVIETGRLTVLGRDVVELRVFLRQEPWRMTSDHWVLRFRNRLAAVLELAGLELAVDEWFTPSQRFPSCGCWITRPAPAPPEKSRRPATGVRHRAPRG